MKTKLKSLAKNSYFSIILTVALAFLSAYMILPERGKWSTLPICLVCGFAACVFGHKKYVTAGIFAVTSYFVSAFLVAEAEFAAVCAVFSGVTCILCYFSFMLIKSRHFAPVLFALLLTCAGLFAQFSLFGSPVKAFSAEALIKDYFEDRYDESVILDSFRFDRKANKFYFEVYGENDVTQVKTIYSDGKSIQDNYLAYAEQSVMSDMRLKLQTALREQFPYDKFIVVSRPSGVFDGKTAGVNSKLTSAKHLSFDINLLSVSPSVSGEDLAVLAGKYINAVVDSGIEVGSLRIRGGQHGKMVLSLTAPLIKNAPYIQIKYEPDDPFAKYVTDRVFYR